jgi:flagellar capping protein FliD
MQSVLASGIRIGYDTSASKDMSQSIAAMLDYQGTIYQRVQMEQQLQRDMSQKKADLQDRLMRVQQQYTAQYAALDALLFKLNSTSTSLKGALDALNNSSKSN